MMEIANNGWGKRPFISFMGVASPSQWLELLQLCHMHKLSHAQRIPVVLHLVIVRCLTVARPVTVWSSRISRHPDEYSRGIEWEWVESRKGTGRKKFMELGIHPEKSTDRYPWRARAPPPPFFLKWTCKCYRPIFLRSVKAGGYLEIGQIDQIKCHLVISWLNE